MKDLICVVTGGTSGIGRATALALGRRGAKLILLGRNARAGPSVVDQLGRIHGAPTADFIPVDLSNLGQVRLAAAQIVSTYPVLHFLINNAGARYDHFQASADGIELTFAGNHLGHFLLTALLLEKLLAAPAAHIITVSSGNHSAPPRDGRWELRAPDYDRRRAYALSKLANMVFAFDLARRLAGRSVTSNAYDPGGVSSNFARNNGLISWGRHLLSHGLNRDLVSPARAAEDLVRLCHLQQKEKSNGACYRRDQRIAAPAAMDETVAAGLWDLSLRLTGLGDDIRGRTEKFLKSRSIP